MAGKCVLLTVTEPAEMEYKDILWIDMIGTSRHILAILSARH